MRRKDVLLWGGYLLLAGGSLYGAMQALGWGSSAQAWSSGILLLGCLGWVLHYLTRVTSGHMTFHHQKQVYEKEQLQEALNTLTPEAWQALQAELEAESEESSA
ncbi:MAG: DUF3007 family protein [Cyanobacteriota bacterium]|nr:DUF3007 family protein [Cyanobacteriota bacterium]